MTLVEHDNESAALDEALAGCLTGSGEVVIVSGAVATGKTVLVRSFAERAVESGALVLTALASRAERALPLGVMSQLFRGLDAPSTSGRINRLLDVAAFSAPHGEEAPGGEAMTLPPALLALCDELLDLAVSRLVVIAIDDLQYADPLSLHCVLYLVRRLRSASMMVVLADRSRPLQQNAHFHAEIIRQPHCRRLNLRLLSPRGVARLLAHHHGAEVEPEVASAHYAMTGGSASLVRALAEDQRGTTALSGSSEPVAGDAYRQAVTSCLCRCEATVLEIAKALAVLGTAGSPALVGRLAGLNAHSAEQSLKVLAATGLVEAERFRHEGIRQAVLDGITPEERSTLHGEAAGLLYEEGAPTKAVAGHLVATDAAELRRMDAGWSVPVLREAAELALFGGEVNLAISFLRKAHQACVQEDDRVAITAALSRAEWRVDPSTVVRHLPLLTAALREGRLTGRQAMDPISYLLWFGRAREGAEALEQLGRTATALDPGAAAHLDVMRLGLSWCYPGYAGRRPDEPASAPATPVSSLSLRGKLQALTLLSRVLADDVTDDALAGAEQILQGARLDHAAVLPVTATLAALIYADRQKNAASWCERLLAETTDQAPLARAVCAALQAVISVRLGDLPAAERLAGSALKLVPPASWGVLIGVPLSALVAAMTAMGRFSDAAVYLDIPVPEAMFQTPSGLHYLESRGLYHLAGNRLHAALADFQLCGNLMSEWRLDLPTLVPWRGHSARAAFRLGRIRQARTLAHEQLAKLNGASSRAAGTSLRVLAEVGEPERRPALLREAVETLQECGDRLESAHALAALDRALCENGRPDATGELRRRALELAKECGAEPLRSSLLAEAGSGVPDSSDRAYASAAAGLSKSEWRVAELAAAGHTNRQIAKKLYITVSTVEQHLTKAYRKLAVNRRSDLPRWLHNGTSDHGIASP